MEQTETQILAQELINQLKPIPLGGTIGVLFLLIYTNWSGIGLAVALGATLFGGWVATRSYALPTNWVPNWRGFQQPTPEIDARRRDILESQSRSIMWYVAGGENLVLGGLLVWSCLHRSFFYTNDLSIPVFVSLMFIFTASLTLGSCWMGVYLKMRYGK